MTYKSAPIEKGSYFVKGDATRKPTRQPSVHIGMRAIDKQSPEDMSSRASSFVQAFIEFEIEATLEITLPQYPNRFTRPGQYNVSQENCPAGVGAYPQFDGERFVTFGL